MPNDKIGIPGKRVDSYDDRDPEFVSYFKALIQINPDKEGWLITVPKDGKEFFGNLGNHTVIEHDDGTITVSPSIKITSHEGEVHGYLIRGVWEDC